MALRSNIAKAARWYARSAAYGHTRGIDDAGRLQPLVDAADDEAFGFAHLASINAYACSQATKIASSEAARFAAAPRPPQHVKWGASCCDNLFCTTAPPFMSLSCKQCGDARFCSTACQAASWRGAPFSQLRSRMTDAQYRAMQDAAADALEVASVGDGVTLVESHRAWCGKLAPAPRPLRLVHRGVLHPGLSMLGLLLDPASVTPARTLTLTKKLACSDAFFGADKHGRAERATASDVRKLADMLKRAAPQRLFLVLQPPCAAHVDDKHPALVPLSTVFEFDFECGPLTAEVLIESTRAALAYIYHEEDRLAPGGARYAPGLACTVGTLLPPYMASKMGAVLDATGRVAAFQVPDRVFYLPPRVRWATDGPFRIGEMCLEDSMLVELSFSKVRVPPGVTSGPLHDVGAWCVTANFEA